MVLPSEVLRVITSSDPDDKTDRYLPPVDEGVPKHWAPNGPRIRYL